MPDPDPGYNPGEPGGSATLPGNQGDDDDDSGNPGSQPPAATPPDDDTNADTSDTATPFSHDPDDDRSYVVSGDGQVAYYQGGHTYRVSDDDLADAVRTALATGDASGLSYVDRVSVYDAAGHRYASNYEHHAESAEAEAEAVLSEFASVDEQVEWFRDQVRNLPADPAQAAQRLTELAVIAAGLGQHWSGRDAVAPQTYFANLSEIFNASAAANQDIAQANAGLPSAPAAATPAAEIAEIRADNAALLASADDLGIGYDDRHPDFEQIRADVQESVDQQNAEYVNHYLGEDTVSSGTAPTQEQIDQAGAAAVEQQVRLLESQGIDTSELTNEQVASMVAPVSAAAQRQADRQNANFVNHYLGEDTVPSGTAPTQEQIDQAGAAAVEQQVRLLESQGIDTSELTNEQVASMVAPVSAAAQRQADRQNANFVNHYLGEDTVPRGTAPTQEQLDQASAAAVEQQVQLLESQGIDTSELTNEQVASMVAPVSAAAQRQADRQNANFVNHYLGEDTVPSGTAPTQEQIDQAGAAAVEQQVRLLESQGIDTSELTNEQVASMVAPVSAAAQRQYERELINAEARDSRIAALETGFHDQVAGTLGALGEGVGIPESHPDYAEYNRLRTDRDGPHWKREERADRTERARGQFTLATVDVGPIWDAGRAVVTGTHVSNYDSAIPVDINALDLTPVLGTLADAQIRGRDGYSRGDIAWLAGTGLLDVAPLPGAQAVRGGLRVVRHPLQVAEIATGGRRTLQSVSQGTGAAPYQLTGTRSGPQGISNIPVRLGDDIVVDGQQLPAWEGLLRQRDEAIAEYLSTGRAQEITYPTADGGTQTVFVSGSRAFPGGLVHTSHAAGDLAIASRADGGLVSMYKTASDGTPLPAVEQRLFMSTTGAPRFLGSPALASQASDAAAPGFVVLRDPRNLANVENVRKVFGGDVDSGVMPPGAVVELEAGIPAGLRIAGDDVPLVRDRPVGLGQIEGGQPIVYTDVPASRMSVLHSNVLAGIDSARGRTDNFYVAHRDADGNLVSVRKADIDALEEAGETLDDATRIRTSSGDVRYIGRGELDQAIRALGRGANRYVTRDQDSDIFPDRNSDHHRGLADRSSLADRFGLVSPRVPQPEPRVPEPRLPEPQQLRTPEVPAPRLPQPEPRVPEPRLPEPQQLRTPEVPAPRLPQPEPRVPEPRLPEPQQLRTREVPAPRLPQPEPRVPAPRVPEPRIPQTPSISIERQRTSTAGDTGRALLQRGRGGSGSSDDDVSRRVIPDPVDVEPGLNPREITHYDVTKTTTDLVTGEQTITPVEHVSIGTAKVTAYSPEDPAGNVHRSGPLIIEATEDQVLLESATRRRDARLRDPGAAEIHPHGVSDADRQVVEAALSEARSASVGERPQIRQPAQFTPPTAEQRARMNERFQAQSANVGERPKIRQRSEFTAPTAEQRAKMRERFENQSRSARSGGGSRPTIKQRSGQGLSEESKAERRKVALRPGQGLAKKPDPYAGLTGGGGAARRGGGGRRRRDDEEEERRRRGGTPQITLVVRG